MKSQRGTIDSIRERIDIIDVVREYIPALKKSGRNFKACCPFHNERTPSFNVDPDKQLFYCFGCHKGGNIFNFVMEMDKSSFVEAARKLAQRAGIEWESPDQAMGPREKERLQIKRVLEFACGFYRKALVSSPAAEGARRYISSRKISPAVLEKFEVGFAPPYGDAFISAALKAGYAVEILLKAGLAWSASGGGENSTRDYFHGRILFPIRNARGEVVGFGGRVLGDAQPKYLNSPETPVFSKGKVLYGISQALPTVRKTGKILLLEGYMDVLAAHQFGIEYAAAPLGTALTTDHAAFLKRCCNDVAVMFDPDEAGIRASMKGAGVLMEAGLFVKIARLGGKHDPDEFLHKYGKEAFEKVLAAAVDLIEFQAEVLLEDFKSPLRSDEKAKVAEHLLETISRQSNPIVRDEWIKYAAKKLEVTEGVLHSQLSKKKSSGGRSAAPLPAQSKIIPNFEQRLIQVLLKYPEMIKKTQTLSEKDFQSASCWKIFLAIEGLASEKQAGTGWISGLLEKFPEETAWLAKLSMDEVDEKIVPEKEISTCVRLMRKYCVVRRWEVLKKRSSGLDDREREELKRLNLELIRLKSSRQQD